VEQNYAHYGMPLAHPYGANFRELLGFISYRKKNWQISARGMYVLAGRDSVSTKGSNVGQNIFLSYTTRPFEFGHSTGQGVQTNILQGTIKFTYYLIPDMNLRLELGYLQRGETNSKGYILQNPFLYLGIRSSFWNRYNDY
jgi:hypothetical protein